MSPEARARARQAELQATLARALAGQGDPPAGFDHTRVRIAAESLATKRARGVARAWPGLAAELGDDFYAAFARYAETTPIPALGGPFADGRGFARAQARSGPLPDAGRLETLAADLRFAGRRDGLVPRKWPRLAATWLREHRRLVVAARWPGLGEWWITLPTRLTR